MCNRNYPGGRRGVFHLNARNRLLIVGAGDFASEVLWAAMDVPYDQRSWDVGGFLDDDVPAARERMQGRGIDLPVLGTIAEYQPQPEDLFICAIGSPRPKLAVCEALQARGGTFTNLIHPTAAVAPWAKLGVGVFLWRCAVVSANAAVGNFVTINCFSGLGHDAVVGDGSTLSAHCDVTGHAQLGRGVFMGSHATVLPGVRVGDFATVGAGTVVLRKVSPETTVFGVPAKVL